MKNYINLQTLILRESSFFNCFNKVYIFKIRFIGFRHVLILSNLNFMENIIYDLFSYWSILKFFSFIFMRKKYFSILSKKNKLSVIYFS